MNFVSSVWRASRAPRASALGPTSGPRAGGRTEGRGGALYLRLERVRLADDVVVEITVAATAVVIPDTSAPVVTPLVARSLRPARACQAHRGRLSLWRAPLALR